MAKGVANHRDGGRDPTELELTVQPANTARPVGRHTSRKYLSQPVMGGHKGRNGTADVAGVYLQVEEIPPAIETIYSRFW